MRAPEEIPEEITAMDLLDVLADAGKLEVFCRLPAKAQEEFKSWIGRARDNASHWRRIDALVAAMVSSPFNPHQDFPSSANGRTPTSQRP